MRAPMRFLLSGSLFVTASALVAAGCGEAKQERAGDVSEACDRLEDLAGVVLSLQSATAASEVRIALAEPVTAFVEAAEGSGDEQLAELAHTYDSRLSAYLEGSGIDSLEAGNEANIALDRAGARCIELGADNDFPTDA